MQNNHQSVDEIDILTFWLNPEGIFRLRAQFCYLNPYRVCDLKNLYNQANNIKNISDKSVLYLTIF